MKYMYTENESPSHPNHTARRSLGWLAAAALAVSSGVSAAAETVPDRARPGEIHLSQVTQLTFGGENAEAYWSPDGERLIFQARRPPVECDQIFTVEVPEPGSAPGEATRVSTGEGRTTCAYFTWPDGERILYSSTHGADAACPAPPDRSQGYVWPIYPSYEIYSARPDGSDLRQLTDNDAYDAEATVCPLDGSILFTSTRDGDLDLYRMRADGSQVVRLTDTPGYDGGAFFSADCTRIVWRASRPPEGEELDEYRRLLEQDLVRPSELEIWVADADGSHPRQITYLGVGSFAPYFFPDGERVMFSTNWGQENPREFDLWAVDVTGARLERITHSEGFDGFPMFSPDGARLAFASNRDQGAPGETNVFVARWDDEPPAGVSPTYVPTAADRFQADVVWLAADARQGRGVGTEGLTEAVEWLAARFAEIGLEPGMAIDSGAGGYLQPFEVETEVEVEDGTEVVLDGVALSAEDFQPAAFSASGRVGDGSGGVEVVPVGYGVTADELDVDDYEGVDVEGKIALVRRFLPSAEADPRLADEGDRRRYSALRYKAFNAREHGAAAVLIVDLPELADGEEMPEEATSPQLAVDGAGDAGLPVAIVSREAGRALFDGGERASLTMDLSRRRTGTWNVVARLPAGTDEPLTGGVVLGAHIDHLGLGGRGSLAPGEEAVHNGADDNASGVAALLEAARVLAERRDELVRDVWFVAFSAEESGILGSSHFVRNPPDVAGAEELVAMVNMDMVGRLEGNTLAVLGGDSAEEWAEVVEPACERAALSCTLGGDGYGPSDHTPFYAAGTPVLHLFTGVHTDYHKPSDDSGRINAAGGARVAHVAADVVQRIAARSDPLTYKRTESPPPSTGDSRSFGASLGTIPDYAGAPGGKGVLLSGVRPGSPAEEAGIQGGDVLVGMAGREIGDIYDFVYILRDSKPGETVSIEVLRDGVRLELSATLGKSRGR